MRARRKQRARHDRDAERAPADRSPAVAELTQDPRPRLALEALHGRNRDEDERNGAADPDDRGKQVHRAQD